jgi:hypothetical protein
MAGRRIDQGAVGGDIDLDARRRETPIATGHDPHLAARGDRDLGATRRREAIRWA